MLRLAELARIITRRLAPRLVMAWCVGMAGCDRGGETAEPVPRIEVVATVYPLADIARQVGGQWVNVRAFLEGGQDPRNLTVSDNQRKQLRDANIVLTSGYDDSWTKELGGRNYRLEHLLGPQQTNTGKKDALAIGGQGDLWLDMKVAGEFADLVADRLSIRDPQHGDEYHQRAAAFKDEVEQLDGEFRAALAQTGQKKFLSARPTWGALAHCYGLEEIAPGDTVAWRLTPQAVLALRHAARENQTDVLAVDTDLPPAEQAHIQAQTGLRLLRLDACGSSASDGRSTYIRLMRYNLEELRRILK